MVAKLLENGPVTRQFFDRYKDELASNKLVIRDTNETIPEVNEDTSKIVKKRKNVIIKNTRGVKRNHSKKNKKSPGCRDASKVSTTTLHNNHPNAFDRR